MIKTACIIAKGWKYVQLHDDVCFNAREGHLKFSNCSVSLYETNHSPYSKYFYRYLFFKMINRWFYRYLFLKWSTSNYTYIFMYSWYVVFWPFLFKNYVNQPDVAYICRFIFI